MNIRKKKVKMAEKYSRKRQGAQKNHQKMKKTTGNSNDYDLFGDSSVLACRVCVTNKFLSLPKV